MCIIIESEIVCCISSGVFSLSAWRMPCGRSAKTIRLWAAARSSLRIRSSHMRDANLRTKQFCGSHLATHKQLMPSISPAKLVPRARVNRPEIGKGPQPSAPFFTVGVGCVKPQHFFSGSWALAITTWDSLARFSGSHPTAMPNRLQMLINKTLKNRSQTWLLLLSFIKKPKESVIWDF